MAAQPILHVVAHPDDDLYFIAPDLADAIRSDQAVTVFLTAGQLNGNGDTPAERARSRQRGICDAYAHTAGFDVEGDQSEWTADLIEVAERFIERFTLNGTAVQVVFVGLPDGQLNDVRAGAAVSSVLSEGGLAPESYTYDADDVRAVVTGLIDAYEPAQVRSLDPLPESRYIIDHPDHTAAARFVADTTANAVPYRGYSIGALPGNLAPEVEADKLSTALVYGQYDHFADPTNYVARVYRRWPRGCAWVGHNADGREQVFVVVGGVVRTWWKTPDGVWAGPVDFAGAGGPLAQTLAVGRNADGRMEIFGRRLTDHHVVCLWQIAPNGAWAGGWASLGNHNDGLPNAGQYGTPAVASNADGRLQIFVKNGGGGVSTRAQSAPDNGWGPWVDLGGTDVQDGLSAVLGPSGRIELFATTRDTVLHWYQPTPNGGFVFNPTLPALVPASPATAVVGPDNRFRVVYRSEGGVEVAVSVQAVPDGEWQEPVAASGPGGDGQLAAAVVDGQVQVYARNATGGLSQAVLNAASAPGPWTDLHGTVENFAVVPDSTGTLPLAFGVGTDGHPQQRTLPSGTWVPLP